PPCGENDVPLQPCRQINRAVSAEKPLGSRDEAIPGAKNLVDARDVPRPIGESRDRLRPANPRDASYTEKISRGKQLRVRPRRSDDDARHARDACGNYGHQERGDEREAAARNVAADTIERADELAYPQARFDLERPWASELVRCAGR